MNTIGYELDHPRLRSSLLKLLVATMHVAIPKISIMLFYYTVVWDSEELSISEMYLIGVIALFLSASVTSFLILYTYFLLSIRMRFRSLNVALRNALSPSRLHEATAHRVNTLLDICPEQHANLTVGLRILNKSYSFQVNSYIKS